MNRDKYRRNKNKGFTLAELLVVVAITIILAAVGFIAIFQYQQNLKFTEMENDAREVFLAAQNSLTSMKENGVELNDPKLEKGDITGSMSKPSDFSKAFEKSGISGTADDYWNKNQSHFKYISHIAGEAVDKDHEPLLNQILDFGSLDDTVRISGSYIIEYDEETYTVYGVFYSDSRQIESNNVDLSKYYNYLDENRENKENRKNFGKNNDNLGRLTTAGYYGAAADDNIDVEKGKAPRITIYNSGKITYLQEKKGKASTIVSEVIGSQEFQDDRLKYVTAGVQGTLKDTLSLAVRLPNAVDKKDLSRIEVEVSGDLSREKETIKYNFSSASNPDWINKGKNYYLTLDDIFSANKHFEQQYKGFIPGENISVTVKFIEKNGKESLPKTLPTNSLFDLLTDNTVEVRSPRQLQNLEPSVSDVSNLDSNPPKKTGDKKLTINNVNVTRDIDWNWNGTSTSGGNEVVIRYNNQKVQTGNDTSKYFLSINNADIKSFNGKTIDASDKTEKTHTISNLNIIHNEVKIDNNTTHNDAGLFAYTDKEQDLTINDLTLKDINVSVKDGDGSAGGLVGEAKGNITVTNVTVDETKNADITAKLTNDNNNYGSAGGLIGEAYGNVSIGNAIVQTTGNLNITSQAGNGYSLNKDDSAGSAGGLIGYASAQNISLTNSSVLIKDHNHTDNKNNSIVVYGSNRAGGIIGYLNVIGGTENEIQNIQYDGGSYGLVKADDRESGGFIGKIENKGDLSIKDSYTTTYVYTEGKNDHLGRAGGFIGYVDNQNSGKINISRSFYGGRTTDKGNYDDKKDDVQNGESSQIVKGSWNIVNKGNSEDDDHATAGGFVGTVSGDVGSLTIEDSYTTGSAYVNDGAVGGFIGQAGTSENSSDSPLVVRRTYATGKVEGASNDSVKGTFTGRNAVNADGDAPSYYLAYINSSDTKVIGNLSSDNVQGILSASTSDEAGPFNNAANGVPAVPYDNLEGTYPYKFVTQLGGSTETASTLTQHVGDWPIANEPKAVKGTFGLLYYEKIQNDPKFYYNGYMVEEPDGLTLSQQENLTYDKANYKHLQTSLNTDEDPDQDGLINTKGKYVSEDGYILLVNNTDADQERLKNTWVSVWGVQGFNEGNFDFTRTTAVPLIGTNSILAPYNGIDLADMGLAGYQAYSFDMNKVLTTWNFDAEQHGASLTFFEKYSDNDNNDKYVNKASFSFMPVFAGSIKSPGSDGKLQAIGKKNADGKDVYQIRSARQFNTLADLDGDKIRQAFLADAGGDSVIQIAMDITYDQSKVRFTMCDASGNTVDADSSIHIYKDQSGNYISQTFTNTSPNAILESSKAPDGQLYSLDGLTNPLVGKNIYDYNHGTIRNLVIENSNIPYLVGYNGGGISKIDHVSIKNTNFTDYGVTYQNAGTISNVSLDNCHSFVDDQNNKKIDAFANTSSGTIENCSISNSDFTGNGVVSTTTGSQSIISGIDITNTKIGGNGLADNNSGNIENCSISNSDLSENGVVITNDSSRKISGINITNTKIGDNGLVATNNGTIENSNIRNAQIGKNGAFESSTWTSPVSNIHIYNAEIGGNGFMDNTLSDVSDCSIVNAQIGGNGFARTVSAGNISNCYVVGNQDKYQVSNYYHPNQATIDNSVNNGKFGYNLVTIGLQTDSGFDQNTTDDHAGFIHDISGGNVNINNCYVAGKVYGNNAYGFIGNITGGTVHINNSYANTIVNAVNTGSGFAGQLTITWGSDVIKYSHSLGIINAGNGAGFAVDATGNKISNSYSAVWRISGMNSGAYKPFSNAGSPNNNYVMEFADGLGNYNWDTAVIPSATKITSEKLKENNNLGLGVSIDGKGETHKYYQYAVAGLYPYPMPLITDLNTSENTSDQKTLDHYGDWYDPDNQDILINPHAVQFFNENGTPLSDTLYVNDGASVISKIPDVKNVIPEGKAFDGWYKSTDFTDENKITDDQFSNVKSDITAYAHYVRDDNYVEFHYVNPTNNVVGSLGVAEISKDAATNTETVTEPSSIQKFGGYDRDAAWTLSADGTGESYTPSDNKITFDSSSNVKDLYLHYHKKQTHTITVEVRANNPNKTYPQIHQSYIYEYSVGEEYHINLTDLQLKINNYDLDQDDGLRVRTIAPNGTISYPQVSNPSEGQLTVDKNNVVTVSLNGTAGEDKTYVVWYNGAEVNYTVSHIFYNSKINGQNPVTGNNNYHQYMLALPTNITDNQSKLNYINNQITYSSDNNDCVVVSETRQGYLGEYIDLEKEAFTSSSDNSDTGYTTVLNPDNNFVLNNDNQDFTINYSRKKYLLSIDTNGAEVVTDSPIEVPFGDDISANSGYLNKLPSQGRAGYTFNGTWTYKDTATQTQLPADTTKMPAENITVTANWDQKKTASYKVEVWTQKVDASQEPGMKDEEKQYDFYNSFTIAANDYTNNQGVGTEPGFLQTQDGVVANNLVYTKLSSDTSSDDSQNNASGLKYFDINMINTVNRNSNITIRPDGTTVYRVFYDRKTIKFNFVHNPQLYIRYSGSQRGYIFTPLEEMGEDSANGNNVVINSPNRTATYTNPTKNRSGLIVNYNPDTDKNVEGTFYRFNRQGDNIETYQGLYGQDFKKADDLFQNSAWEYYNPKTGRSVGLGSLMGYVLPGDDHDQGLGNENTLTLYSMGPNTNDITVYHYQEQLDGSWKRQSATKTKVYVAYNGEEQPFLLSDKYDGFKAVGFASGHTEVDIAAQSIKPVNPVDGYYLPNGSKIMDMFYERKSYEITLENVEPMANVTLNGYKIDNDNNISVKYEQALKDIGLPTDNEEMKKYIPKSVDQNGETEDYTFGGWYTSATFDETTKVKDNDIMPSHNIRLYAKWIAPQYKITYMDGKNQIYEEKVNRYDNISLQNEASIKQTANYSKDGYTFAGWYEDKDLKTEYLPGRAVTGDQTLYAKYEKAPGTDISYTVRYVDESGNTDIADPVTRNVKVGDPYEELPLDIPNAICLDVRAKGYVTSDMDGTTKTFRYLRYEGSSWKYKVEHQVQYTDINTNKSVTAVLKPTEASTTNMVKTIHAETINGYQILEPSSQSVDKLKESQDYTFKYEPNYNSLEIDKSTTTAVYGSSEDPEFTGMNDWIIPEGWHLETRSTYKDSSGQSLSARPKNAGVYKADVGLYLVNGEKSMLLYIRENVPYIILKKKVVLTSASKSWTHDGTVHSEKTVTPDQNATWIAAEGAKFSDFATIRDIGSIPNEFTATADEKTSFDNYNVYRKFGMLTVTPNGTTDGEAATSAG